VKVTIMVGEGLERTIMKRKNIRGTRKLSLQRKEKKKRKNIRRGTFVIRIIIFGSALFRKT